MKQHLTLIGIFIISGILFSACGPSAMTRRADKLYDALAYMKAANQYKKILKKDSTDTYVMSRLANCYLQANEYKKSVYWYQKVTNLDPGIPENQFNYGQMLMANKQYDEAAIWFKKFLEFLPDDKLALKALESCQNWRELMKDSSLYNISEGEFNSPSADFAPLIDGNKVIFASARTDDKFIFAWTEKNFLDLYEVEVGEEGDFGEPKLMKGRVNSKFHEAVPTISASGDTMYFTRNNFNNGRIGFDDHRTITLKTYFARRSKNGKKWVKVKEFEYNNDNYSIGHPAIGPKGKFLYLASDMPGGQGGTDIYVCRREGDHWGEPQNLGPTINTEGDEMFPWVSPEGVLYFASDGHPGLGSLDVFRADKDASGKFEKPVNMGYPINTPQDDFHLVMEAGGNTGYLSSNRDGGMGDDDIYYFRAKKLLKGLVVDKKTRQPIDNPRLEFYVYQELDGVTLGDPKGEFSYGIKPNYEYSIIASKPGYQDAKIIPTARQLAGKDPIELELAKSEECGPEFVLMGEVIDIENNPIKGSPVRVILKEKVIYTDDNGKFSMPLAPNQDYVVVAMGGEGRPDKEEEVTTKGLDESAEIPVTLMLDPTYEDTGKVFYIIYYNYDRYSIRRDASEELERVAKFMYKYPTIIVELSSHTDSRGSVTYNDRLSRDRAKSAYDYLISKGVEPERLTYKWFGETMLVNDCNDGKECEEDEHQLNRRTEFRFMGFVGGKKVRRKD
ncbi:MAG: OmpA family protein [Bacteroidia bacterium]|nr:OmpA family protein [Bacteroidia bacterium]